MEIAWGKVAPVIVSIIIIIIIAIVREYSKTFAAIAVNSGREGPPAYHCCAM